MQTIHFIKEFLTNPRSIGAVMPSSKQLAKQMTEPISYLTATCIVEYGPGTGVFTEEIIRDKRPQTILLLLEQSEEFCTILKEKYAHVPNVHIRCDSAEHVGAHMQSLGCSKADYMISGLPFTSLPLHVSHKILYETSRFLDLEGTFITFQYTRAKQTLFMSYFQEVKARRVYWNVPPAFVFTCKHALVHANGFRPVHLPHASQSEHHANGGCVK